jgi:prevent-host-death family protein
MKTVGSYEAKTKLPELIKWVEETHEELIITRRGKEVVKIISVQPEPNVTKVVDDIRELRKRNVLGSNLTVQELVAEGRR